MNPVLVVMSFEKLVKIWKQYLRHELNCSENTVAAYTLDLELLRRFLRTYSGNDEISVCEVNKQNMRAWILSRYNAGESSKTISRGQSTIKNFHRFLLRDNHIEKSEILSMRSPRCLKSLPRPLNVTDLDQMLNCIKTLKNTNWLIERDVSIVILIYSVGLRLNEALNLKRIDVITQASSFIEIIGKGGKVRQVPLLPQVMQIINTYLTNCPFVNSEWLFVNRFGNKLGPTAVQKLIKKTRVMLNLPDNVTPHSLRHTCATHLMENSGGDIRSIQELLGHASLNTTQVYVNLGKDYLTNTYRKCHPLNKKNPN